MKWPFKLLKSYFMWSCGCSHSSRELLAQFVIALASVGGTVYLLAWWVDFTVLQLLLFWAITVPLSVFLAGVISASLSSSDHLEKSKTE